MEDNNVKAGKVIVTAKCPACKSKKDYVMPIDFTPYCQNCFKAPMIIVKITTYGR